MLYGYVPFYTEAIDQMTLFKAIVEQHIEYPPGCSLNCEDFLKHLLVRRPSRRLGSRGADDIARHKWLSQIDFQKLRKQEYKSPYPPRLKSPLDFTVDILQQKTPENRLNLVLSNEFCSEIVQINDGEE